jgi:translation initiation factor 4G
MLFCRYDRAFLLQFMPICREEPFGFTPLDLDLSQIQLPKARNPSINRPTLARSPLNSSREAVDLGTKRFGKAIISNPFSMGNFSPPGISGKRFSRFFRSMSTASQWNKRGGGNNNQAQPDQTQGSGSGGRLQMQLESDSVALGVPQNQRITSSIPKTQPIDPNSLEFVGRKVKGLLNKLTIDNFDSISDQIVTWVNNSEKDTDGRKLLRITILVLESAINDEMWSEMYACLCRTMMERVSPKVYDINIKNARGKPIAGGQLFRKYLLNRIQENFERLGTTNGSTNQPRDSRRSEDEIKLKVYSDEYYAAQRARRRNLGLVRFLGELFKVKMLTERIMHNCIKIQLGNIKDGREENIERVCKLLTTAGQILDTNKARAHMDVYFSCLKEVIRGQEIRPRLRFNLQVKPLCL